MIIAAKKIVIKKVELVLTNQRVVYLPAYETLVLSDMHIGKSAYFRKNGIPIPAPLAKADLDRLSKLIVHFQAKKLLIVGDFLHAGQNNEVMQFAEFRKQFSSCSFVLVKGNHDRVSDVFLFEIGISEMVHAYQLGELHFLHENNPYLDSFQINGHIHPGITLYSKIKKSHSFPAYIWTDKQLILPAFSLFTGLDTKKRFEHAIYFPFYEEGIFETH